ncbi:MAG: VOC family protein [Desulfuromonadales bacterium]|nr:VOC family protein [Desulfuromonadales bacterium]
MKITDISTALTTENIEETKNFYIQHFGAKVTFDCGWYVNLEFGSQAQTLQFMSPQNEHQRPFDGAGVTFNFAVENVDEVHEKLVSAGLKATLPLEDHDWGDRGFAVQDPNGVTLYIYTLTEPSAEFKKFFID